MRPFLVIMALFCGAKVCAQEPNPEQLFRDAQQAQQSGNNELAVQKYQELLTAHPEVVAARANLVSLSPPWAAMMKQSLRTARHCNSSLATVICA
jgi:outer membrane protein assembly factor BamD (BamD/ComL family)